MFRLGPARCEHLGVELIVRITADVERLHLGPIAAGNIERLRRRGLAQPNPVTLAPYPTHLLFQAVPI